MLLFSAFLEDRGCIKKLKVRKMDLSPLFFFSIEAMQKNFTLVSPSKPRLHIMFSAETEVSETLLGPG